MSNHNQKKEERMETKTMKLSEMDVKDLKALTWDLSMDINDRQRKLQAVNAAIATKLNGEVPEVPNVEVPKEEPKKEEKK
jgi:hypothetical protein